jgi:hypothetical protein
MPPVKKNPHAVALGRKGGLQRTKNHTKQKLSQIGKAGAAARWGTRRKRSR